MRTLERAGGWAPAIQKSRQVGTRHTRVSLFQWMGVRSEQLQLAPVLSPGSANCKAVLKCKTDLTRVPIYHSILTGDSMREHRGEGVLTLVPDVRKQKQLGNGKNPSPRKTVKGDPRA